MNNLAMAVVVVVAVVFVASRLKRAARVADAPPRSIDAMSLETVRRQLGEGQKIKAIKTYKEATGASLKTAKDAVEALDGRPMSAPSRGFDAAAHADVREALLLGKKIQAIRLYREATGVGLKEAKEAVEAMAVNEGVGL